MDDEYPTFTPSNISYSPRPIEPNPSNRALANPASIKSPYFINRKTSAQTNLASRPKANPNLRWYTPANSIRTQSRKIIIKHNLGQTFKFSFVFLTGLALGLIIGLVIAIIT
ncbi:MAG: hypothetical protein LBC43_01560 [Bifidobacteriaceae bacterium]|nr:hypothetical protein [Bifidobacteriaceae bacterium]